MHTTTSPSGWDAHALAGALQRLKDRGYKPARIAELAQISRSQVSRWSSGDHRPGYESLERLSAAILAEHPTEEYREILRDLCTAAGYPGIVAPDARGEEMVSPYSGEVWRIVRSLERRAEDAGLTPEQEREAIEAVMRRAEEAMERDLDAELYRRERDRPERQT